MDPRQAAYSGSTRVLYQEQEPAPLQPVSPSREQPPILGGLLESILEITQASQGKGQRKPALDLFLEEKSPEKALAFWLDRAGISRADWSKSQIKKLLHQQVGTLDDALNRQVNSIIHHPQFQKLEASWRGLRYLVDQVEEGANIKIKLLNISWKELAKDVDQAIEFDQSRLFQRIYNDEFGMPGGEPFGVLLGDYEIHPRPSPDHPTDDLDTLGKIAGVAAAAFAPFLTSAHPSLLGLNSFTDLERPFDLSRAFEQLEFRKWNRLRQQEDVRFAGLTLPRVLFRVPYPDDGSRADGFRFQEDVDSPDQSRYLWGNAVYALGAVLVRAFAESAWLADIRGVPPGGHGGGLVKGLPSQSFATDATGLMPKPSTDVIIPDFLEKELGDSGFIPLCYCPDTENSVFYGNQSIQQPKKYDNPGASANARLSAMLQYILCVSRFAHYLKVIARDKLGGFTTPEQCEEFLHTWLMRYVASPGNNDPETKASFPLRDARVQVREIPGKPGSLGCVMHLQPHYQLDQMITAFKLTTELTPGQGR